MKNFSLNWTDFANLYKRLKSLISEFIEKKESEDEMSYNEHNNLKNNDIVALERHGSLSIGSDVDKILEDIETLEYYTGIELNTRK